MKSKMRTTFIYMLFSGVMMATLAVPVMPVEAATTNGWDVKDLSGLSETGKSPEQILVESLLGDGVTVSNVKYTGTSQSAGTFKTTDDVIGFQEGIILSNGRVQNVIGPNLQDAITANNGLPGDSDLDSLIPGYQTHDATVLEFDFIPDKENISFQYVFGSDEYNEYSHSNFNDVFGFYLNGTNVAKLDNSDTIVSINNINGGNPFGTNASNPLYFRNNDPTDGTPTINTEMDGLTVVLSVYAPVKAQEVNHIKLAIADAGDSSLDSNVFIKAKSITVKENTPPVAADDSSSTNEAVPVTVDVLGNDSDADGDQLMVTNVSNGVNGTTTISHNGSAVIYTPSVGFLGNDSFTYVISDGKGATAQANVAISVVLQPKAVTAVDDIAQTTEYTPVTVDVLTNDIPNEAPVQITSASQPANGVATIVNNGTAISYTPNLGFSGSDEFSYTITNGKGATASANVTIKTVASQKQNGSMKGGGSFTMENGQQVNFNYGVYSLNVPAPNTLEIKWAEQGFKLTKLNTLDLVKGVGSSAGTGINNYAKGTGSGTINGVDGATIEFLFSDTNVKGNDFAKIIIKDANGDIVLSASGTVTTGDNSAYFWMF